VQACLWLNINTIIYTEKTLSLASSDMWKFISAVGNPSELRQIYLNCSSFIQINLRLRAGALV
jgi:hypothetical protein